MPTATANRAPTEAEIREAIETQMPTDDQGEPQIDEPERLYGTFRVILDSDMALVRAGWKEDYSPNRDHPGTLWADMRPAEVSELEEAIETARDAALRDYLFAVREGVIAAAVAFAEAHPEIPRGAWRPAADREPVTA